MADTVMLNTRIDKTLKDHGMQVLNAQGMSTTRFIHRAFEYLEANQDIPECLKEPVEGKYVKRRALLRSAVGLLPAQPDYDPLEDKHARVDARYEGLMA